MAVYAALFPLKSKIRGYLKYYDACYDPPSLELLQILNKEVISFQKFVERLDSCSRKAMNPSLLRIAEAITKFHDLFLWHFLDQTNKDENRRKRLLRRFGLPAEEEDDENRLSFPTDLLAEEDEDDEDERNRLSQLIDLRGIKREIHSFIETLKGVQEECKVEINGSSSTTDFRRNKSKMVGLSDLHATLKEDIVRAWGSSVKLLSIVGMAGIGKTTLAKEIFEDLDFVEWFEYRAWVEVGREWQLNKIIRDIVAQFKPDEMLLVEEKVEDDDERMSMCLTECLEGKRYLIILDDVWDALVWNEVKELLESITENVVGSRVLLTTRIRKVADRAGLSSGLDSSEMRLLNKEESWDLLREKVFDMESCSFQLERIGRRISDKCHGLPLTIVAVADLLSKSDKTTEYWSQIATQANHQLFTSAYDEVSKVLHPSYENLPHHLKMCFLYIGVFPQNHEIPASHVRNLWIAEGLVLDPNKGKSSKKHALKCLNELASNNVIVFQNSTKSSSDMSIAKDEVKSCGLHSSWWHLCYKEARKNNFFHVLNSRQDSLAYNIRGQTRLSIQNNILLGIKEVYNSLEENCASSAHSLLFNGPYSRFPIPICPSLKLLEVLDAFKIRFYEFPLQVLELVELKYLALTYDGKIPPSISNLQKLEFLIVHPHQNIKSFGDSSYLPLEIWDITELKHLQAMGRDFPDSCGIPLLNLVTILDVGGNSCTKSVFARIPNVRKLGIRIELPPDHSGYPMSCLDHISNLEKLESLKCVIVNPELEPELLVSSPPTIPAFPKNIKKLALSGMGYPWAEMSKIASLENLEVLKLQCGAFQGEKWEIEENSFPALEYLLIEDCDLEQWRVGDGNFRWLEHLSIKHCYKLEVVEWEFNETISWIEVVDCDPAVGKQIKECMWGKGVGALDFSLHSSWNEKSHKIKS